jgi:putative acetyltransferase
MKMLEIVAAETETHYQKVRELLAEFISADSVQLAELGLDTQAALDFYFNSGQEELPGVYAPPDGRMFLATYSGKSAGCGAFRKMAPDTCEMKRMYVRPEFRGKQVGWRLANSLILTAREAGYSIMRLETTTYSDRANALYSALGFRICQPYSTTPEMFRGIIVCMELDLVKCAVNRTTSD